MIEIMVTEIANYDMVQILQKVEQGEQVVLSHNGMAFSLIPNPKATSAVIEHDKTVHLADLFERVQIQLPSDYQFDREEANSR